MRAYIALVLFAVLIAACKPAADMKNIVADTGMPALEDKGIVEKEVIEEQEEIAAEKTEGAGMEKSGSMITIQDLIITPTELTVAAGTEVAVTVNGATAHIITVNDDATYKTVANLGTLANGKSAIYVFDTPGVYTVKSLKAGTVRATVTVR